MGALFREVWPWSGVDETYSGGVSMIIPMGGSNFIQLENGEGLDVVPKKKGNIVVHDLAKEPNRDGLRKRIKSQSTLRQVAANPARRTFEIVGKNPAGYTGIDVEAIDPKSKKVEAKFHAVPMRPRKVTVSIRPVQVRDAAGILTLHSKLPFDAKKMLEWLTLIISPQTNIVFSLGLTTPAPVLDEAVIAKVMEYKPGTKAVVPNTIGMDRFRDVFVKLRDPKADATVFLVEKTADGLTQNGAPIVVDGVMDSTNLIGFVSDLKDVGLYARLLAHEVGHYLGRYFNDTKKKTVGFDDLHSDANKLMHQGGSGWNIPFEHCLNYFNRTGY